MQVRGLPTSPSMRLRSAPGADLQRMKATLCCKLYIPVESGQ